MTPTTGTQELTARMYAEHGPLLQGNALYQALGYNTYAAFHRARHRGDIGVRIFPIAGRRGIFALTGDVAIWLIKQAELAEGSEAGDFQEKEVEQSVPNAQSCDV